MALFKHQLDLVLRNARLFCTAQRRTHERPKHVFSVKRASDAQTAVFEKLRDSTDPKKIKWASLRDEILNTCSSITKLNIDSMIVSHCFSEKKLDTAKSYIKFLKENQYDINLATIGKYMRLFHLTRDTMTEAEFNEILVIYDNLRQKYPIMDGSTAENCILVISLTQRWEESFELLDMIKIGGKPITAAYSAVVSAAFRNNKPDIGWKYLKELLDDNRSPHQWIYRAYLNYCVNNFHGKKAFSEEIQKMFECWGDYDLKPTKETMDEYISAHKKFQWTGVFTTLNDQGVCRNCRQQLLPLNLSAEDFSTLSSTVLEKVIVGKNLYSKTTPEELTKLLEFIERTKPYDVVIDGLNVAYTTGTANTKVLGKQLATVVRHFVERRKKVLVLGRRHMMFWSKPEMKYIQNKAQIFLTDDLSQDDPCLLYATLSSGPNTMFISRDLMRQHKFLMKTPELKRIFKRWQMSHQYLLLRVGTNQVVYREPFVYLPVAQGNHHCWHIPYDNEEMPVLQESYQAPETWVCLRKN